MFVLFYLVGMNEVRAISALYQQSYDVSMAKSRARLLLKPTNLVSSAELIFLEKMLFFMENLFILCKKRKEKCYNNSSKHSYD